MTRPGSRGNDHRVARQLADLQHNAGHTVAYRRDPGRGADADAGSHALGGSGEGDCVLEAAQGGITVREEALDRFGVDAGVELQDLLCFEPVGGEAFGTLVDAKRFLQLGELGLVEGDSNHRDRAGMKLGARLFMKRLR